MYDWVTTKADLAKLHEAALTLPGYFKDQTLTFIDVGEYDLALDTIADAFIKNNLPMPAEFFVIFSRLVSELHTLEDPEYSAVAELIAKKRV